MSPTPYRSTTNDPLWYVQAARYGPDPYPEPPGSCMTLAVYRVGPTGVQVLVPPARHRLFGKEPWWQQNEPPCACPLLGCPLKRRSA
ncbi:hypothetical protein ABIA38_008036 [Embleya sp. AB8]